MTYTDVLYTDWAGRADFRGLPGSSGGLSKLLRDTGLSSMSGSTRGIGSASLHGCRRDRNILGTFPGGA